MRTILLATSIISLNVAEALAESAEMGTIPSLPQPTQLSTRQFDMPTPTDIAPTFPTSASVPQVYEQSDNDNHRQDFRMLNFGL